MTCQSWKSREASNTVTLLIIMHKVIICLGLATVSITLAALHPQNKRVSTGKVQPGAGQGQHPGWPNVHRHECGTAAPERLSKPSQSLVPDSNPRVARERAEESAESTKAALEKGSPTGKVRWARVALGQLGGGDTKQRAGSAFVWSRAQLITEVGTLHPGPWALAPDILLQSPTRTQCPRDEQNSTGPTAALASRQVQRGAGKLNQDTALPGRAQGSSARLHAMGNFFSSILLCQRNYHEQQARVTAEGGLWPKAWGFFTIKVPFYFRITSYKIISYLLSNNEFYLGDSKHHAIPQDSTDYFWTYTIFSS